MAGAAAPGKYPVNIATNEDGKRAMIVEE